MRWSLYAARTFLVCQRRWYYANVLANARTKDSDRREAYLLKSLQTIYAWRGSLVDKVISNMIVPSMRNRIIPPEDRVIDYAMQLADKQLTFGKQSKHKDPQVTKSAYKDVFCAFYELEYNGDLDQDQIQQAKDEAVISLKNILSSPLLADLANSCSHITDQVSISFKFEKATVSCTPDLIAFFEKEPPLIIDWKVHTFATYESRLQLTLYALALSRTTPRKGFPPEFSVSPQDVRLVEYQLLNNTPRKYHLTDKDISDVEDYIYQSLLRIESACDGEAKELTPFDFRTARNPRACIRCQFKKMCWKDRPDSTATQLMLPGVEAWQRSNLTSF